MTHSPDLDFNLDASQKNVDEKAEAFIRYCLTAWPDWAKTVVTTYVKETGYQAWEAKAPDSKTGILAVINGKILEASSQIEGSVREAANLDPGPMKRSLTKDFAGALESVASVMRMNGLSYYSRGDAFPYSKSQEYLEFDQAVSERLGARSAIAAADVENSKKEAGETFRL